MSNPVNEDPTVLLTSLLEQTLTRLRTELHDLSDQRYPGLRARHYRLLSFLAAGGERVSRLAVQSGLTKQALAQTLAPLEAAGYVRVTPDPADRRARVVTLTGRGREVNASVVDRLAAVERSWAQQAGAERYAVARGVLAELAGG